MYRTTIRRYVLLSLLYLLGSTMVWAQDTVSEPRPKIALVLGGGGAKGAAHVGVLEALEQLRVPVDIVTGTSMGAYVGGLYAMGLPLDQLKAKVLGIDWSKGYRDKVERYQRFNQDKAYYDRFNINPNLGLDGSGFSASAGILQGHRLREILRQSTNHLHRLEHFDQLPIPYRAVATDIVSFEPVILKHGHMADAMMASMAVPGVLPPFFYQDRLLVDGGVINNLPVNVAKDLGADIIIAVDISTDYASKDELKSYINVASQLTNYLVRQSTKEQREAMSEHDIVLRPDIGDMETNEFYRMEEAYDKGILITQQNKDALARFSITEKEFEQYKLSIEDKSKRLNYGLEDKAYAYEVHNQTRYNDDVIKSLIMPDKHASETIRNIEENVENLYALDRFSSVDYRLVERQDDVLASYTVEEKAWGPNYVNFNIFFEDDFSLNNKYMLGVSSVSAPFSDPRANVKFNMELGSDTRIDSQFEWPITLMPSIYTRAGGYYETQKRNISSDEIMSQYGISEVYEYIPVDISRWRWDFSLGAHFSRDKNIELGGRFIDGGINLPSYVGKKDIHYERYGVFANYRIDTLDSYTFPSSGMYLDAEIFFSQDSIQQQNRQTFDAVKDITLDGRMAHSFKKHTAVYKLLYESLESDNATTPIELKSIGGFLNLSGLPKDEQVGQNKLLSMINYRYTWFENDFGLFSTPVYLGASWEYGGVWSDNDVEVWDAPLIHAGSAFVGIETPVGPAAIAFGKTSHGDQQFYFTVGASF
ncbi:hypothetical protein BZG77_10130 [Salinivibrio sp. IB643]|nr:hypothetical protein BZG77_10130 [Salinivibrio sp. IB643]